MAPREDVVSSAVNFLQNPDVEAAPIEKRMEFLRSKNLTEEEIQLSLARAADPSTPSHPPPSQYYPPPQQYGRPPPQGYGYNYNPYADFHAAPPEPPKRDWRDWFIMATVVGGASYGLYVLAQRYVKPLIAPPTPPQLEQDKAAIDEQFNRAFALIDTLSSDTTALKEAEDARTRKLDTVLADVESVVAELKTANIRREEDARRMAEDITRLKDSLPGALEGVKQGSEKQLKDLSSELTSLKTLIGNRMSGSATTPSYLSSARTGSTGSSSSQQQPSAVSEPGQGINSNVTGVSSAGSMPSYSHGPSSSISSSSTGGAASRPIPTTSTSSTRSSQFATPSSYGAGGSSSAGGGGGKAAIPAWQMAAQNKAKETPATAAVVNGDGTNATTDGADVVAALGGGS